MNEQWDMYCSLAKDVLFIRIEGSGHSLAVVKFTLTYTVKE